MNCIFITGLINNSFALDLFLTILGAFLTTILAAIIARVIYRREFSDYSERILNKEVNLIYAVLAESDENVRNTGENVDASKEKDKHILKKYNDAEQLVVLTKVREEDLNSKFDWDVVQNTYFFSCLENYLNSGKHLNKNILYYANRFRKVAELINNYRNCINAKKNIIDWTRELNLYCYALVKQLNKLDFIQSRIKMSDYNYLLKLKYDFWNNRENMIKNKVNIKIIRKIERDEEEY
ncbi:Uncharacterised protein [uncultured archaeon]|nr:Uncharacterised protein [uncultured archaeon]